jgi:hypothetical protein
MCFTGENCRKYKYLLLSFLIPIICVSLNEKFNNHILQVNTTDASQKESPQLFIIEDLPQIHNSLHKIQLILDWTGYLGLSMTQEWMVNNQNDK